MKTIMPWIGAVLFFALLASNVSAFPLSGGNGEMNATVFGVFKEADAIYVDIATQGTPTDCTFQLIDSDDRIHESDSSGSCSWNSKSGYIDDQGTTRYLASGDVVLKKRGTAIFDVPDGVILKRIRVVPDTSDPFFVDWNGVPEVSDANTTLKFYGATTTPRNSCGPTANHWVFDVKLTNNDDEILEYTDGDFSVVDQFGWEYYSKGTTTNKLLPGESLRFDVKTEMYRLSRPIAIIFRGVQMDISAWA